MRVCVPRPGYTLRTCVNSSWCRGVVVCLVIVLDRSRDHAIMIMIGRCILDNSPPRRCSGRLHGVVVFHRRHVVYPRARVVVVVVVVTRHVVRHCDAPRESATGDDDDVGDHVFEDRASSRLAPDGDTASGSIVAEDDDGARIECERRSTDGCKSNQRSHG